MRIPQLPLKFDDFTPERGIGVFLLTHFHTDHLRGLTPSWSAGVIYCTAITRALVLQRFSLEAHRVVALDLGVEHTIFLAPHRTGGVSVTLMDANHIPGSAMVLIRCSWLGTLLCTGDFKYAPDAMAAQLPPSGAVDHVYIDDTWLHLQPRACKKFLSVNQLDDCFDRLAAVVHALPPRQPRRCVVRCYLHNHFGKELLLQRLAHRLQTTILISDQRYELLEAVHRAQAASPTTKGAAIDLAAFIPRSRAADTHLESHEDGAVVMSRAAGWPLLEVVGARRDVQPQTLEELEAATEGTPHFALIMSGWARMQRAARRTARVFELPFTLHSTPQELDAFVERLRPGSLSSIHPRPSRSTVLVDRLGHHLRERGVNRVVSVVSMGVGNDVAELPLAALKPIYDGNAAVLQTPGSGVSDPVSTRQVGVKLQRQGAACSDDEAESEEGVDLGRRLPPSCAPHAGSSVLLGLLDKIDDA